MCSEASTIEASYLKKRSAHTKRLVPVTSPLKSLQEWTYHKDLYHEQLPQSILMNKSRGLVPKIQTGLNFWDYMYMYYVLRDQSLVPATRF